MKFNRHPELEGLHAFLSPSNHSWQRYSEDHLVTTWENNKKKEQGTRIHAFASEAIKLRMRMDPEDVRAVNLFVNDAIGFGMSSEVPLFANKFVFGTADAIVYDEHAHILRIHDLKTGTGAVHSFDQLNAYAALFMIEYKLNPQDIVIIERLYQFDGFIEQEAPTDHILDLMAKINASGDILEEAEQQRYGTI